MASQRIAFNGINGATGQPLLPPLSLEEVSRLARGERWSADQRQELDWWYRHQTEPQLGAIAGVDTKELAQTGWGIIFASALAAEEAALHEALGELLRHRQAQAGERYREFRGANGYRPEETKLDFLARHGAGPGPVNPTRVPYYLLLVGDPAAIPYEFQYELDVQYAVGRLHFATLAEYAQYARSVVLAETGGVSLARRAVFLGVQQPTDLATVACAHQLVAPLAAELRAEPSHANWQIETELEHTTKADLQALLGGPATPALLFTASHGVGFPAADARQLAHQGALLCREWPGPEWDQALPPDFYLAADDVAATAHPLGLISFHFACYGAGTPAQDEFGRRLFGQATPLAPAPFVAALPQRLLGHPRGGALAMIGHIERAWTFSYSWEHAGPQLAVFRSSLQRLMSGQPVGAAFEDFNVRYAELATALSSEIQRIEDYGKRPDHRRLADLWTANNDARGYAIIGDPAVRLPLTATATTASTRPVVVAAAPSGGSSTPAAVTTPATVPLPGVADVAPTEPAAPLITAAIQRVIERLEALLGDAGAREVVTSVGEVTEATVIRTQLSLRGDLSVQLPAAPSVIAADLWERHCHLVALAQAQQVAVLTAAAEALARLRSPSA